MRVTMPSCAVVVSPVEASLAKHQSVAQQALVQVGVDLDEAVSGDEQPRLIVFAVRSSVTTSRIKAK